MHHYKKKNAAVAKDETSAILLPISWLIDAMILIYNPYIKEQTNIVAGRDGEQVDIECLLLDDEL